MDPEDLLGMYIENGVGILWPWWCWDCSRVSNGASGRNVVFNQRHTIGNPRTLRQKIHRENLREVLDDVSKLMVDWVSTPCVFH